MGNRNGGAGTGVSALSAAGGKFEPVEVTTVVVAAATGTVVVLVVLSSAVRSTSIGTFVIFGATIIAAL